MNDNLKCNRIHIDIISINASLKLNPYEGNIISFFWKILITFENQNYNTPLC
jgi:hypothetical protein